MTIDMDFSRLNDQLVDDSYDKYDQKEPTANAEVNTENAKTTDATTFCDVYFNDDESAYGRIGIGPNPGGAKSFLHGRSRMLTMRNGLVFTIFYKTAF